MPPNEKIVQVARIMWGSLLGAVAMYAVVLMVLLRDPSGEPTTSSDLIRNVFMLLSLAHIAAIYVFRRRLPLEALGTARPAADPPATLTIYIICWSLFEAIPLYGLVLGVLAQSFSEAEPFFLVGAALLVWQRPRAEHFRT
jgi:drug/metabolite transporter (DMT)-like permease